MLFVTNQAPIGSPLRDSATNILGFEFDEDNNRPLPDVYFLERADEGRYIELGNVRFFDEIKASSANQILFFIHGFNTQPEDGLRTAFALQSLLTEIDQSGERSVLVVPFLWPCGQRPGVAIDYFEDQERADLSVTALERVLLKFLAWQTDNGCQRPLNLLAHSMGNRIVVGASRNHFGKFGDIPLLFRNIFMSAADVRNEVLEKDRDGFALTRAARNVVVYHAWDDLALRGSKAANVGNKVVSRRLGHSGPEDLSRTPNNVFSLDCSNFNNIEDPKGHTYFLGDEQARPGRCLIHIWNCMVTGRVQDVGAGRHGIL